MTSTKIKIMRIILAGIAGIAGLFFGEKGSPTQPLALAITAYAIAGCALPPLSHADVAWQSLGIPIQ
jgi:hypothetical protein